MRTSNSTMKPTVLIVDDVRHFREELKVVLEGEFTVVAQAADGIQAVEACRRHSPQLVVMDVVMPNLSGIDATRRIMEGPTPPKVVMLSGLKDEKVVMEALLAGASDYLFKPVDPEKLRKVLWGFLKSAA